MFCLTFFYLQYCELLVSTTHLYMSGDQGELKQLIINILFSLFHKLQKQITWVSIIVSNFCHLPLSRLLGITKQQS